MSESYAESLGQAATDDPKAMLARAMNYLKVIADNTSAIRKALDGDEENLGLVEMVADTAKVVEAADDAILGIGDDKRFSGAEFRRSYVTARAQQEDDGEDEPEQD